MKPTTELSEVMTMSTPGQHELSLTDELPCLLELADAPSGARPQHATDRAIEVDWLIRDLLPRTLRVAGLDASADRCAQLPEITAAVLATPGKLRKYTTATQTVCAAAEEQGWRCFEQAGRPAEVDDPMLALSDPVTALANRARGETNGSWCGWWAYRTVVTTSELLVRVGTADELTALRLARYQAHKAVTIRVLQAAVGPITVDTRGTWRVGPDRQPADDAVRAQ